MATTTSYLCGVAALAVALVACGRAAEGAEERRVLPREPTEWLQIDQGIGEFSQRLCLIPGGKCCEPDAAISTTKHCHNGLGCNIAAGVCEVCGGPDQPCCDGHLTGFSLKGYAPPIDSNERVESCDPGAVCDARWQAGAWVGSRICKRCGTTEGGRCCPPDPRHGVGRCFPDAAKHRLICDRPLAGAAGTCVRCGHDQGKPACTDGDPCEPGLTERDDVCVLCGLPGQPICDQGAPCNVDTAVPRGLECVAAGDADQPCLDKADAAVKCKHGSLFCNGDGICEPCGRGGEACCTGDPVPCVDSLECKDGRCFACGFLNMPLCPGNDRCKPGFTPEGGMCRACGERDQRCCRDGDPRVCNVDKGLRCDDDVCRLPGGGGGGGGGEPAKTCSGALQTPFTQWRPVHYEDPNGCLKVHTFPANSQEEAIECARAVFGEATLPGEPVYFDWAVSCHVGCTNQQIAGRDEGKSSDCVQFMFPDCTVEKGLCPG